MLKLAMTKIMIVNNFFDEDPYYRDQNDKDLLDKDYEKVGCGRFQRQRQIQR